MVQEMSSNGTADPVHRRGDAVVGKARDRLSPFGERRRPTNESHKRPDQMDGDLSQMATASFLWLCVFVNPANLAGSNFRDGLKSSTRATFA